MEVAKTNHAVMTGEAVAGNSAEMVVATAGAEEEATKNEMATVTVVAVAATKAVATDEVEGGTKVAATVGVAAAEITNETTETNGENSKPKTQNS